MKDLTKEEKLEQRISNLEQRVFEMAERCEKQKWLRGKITFFALCGLVYVIALTNDIISGIAGLLSWLIFAPLIAIGVMILSYIVLGYIIIGAMEDEKAIAKMVGRIEEAKFSKYE